MEIAADFNWHLWTAAEKTSFQTVINAIWCRCAISTTPAPSTNVMTFYLQTVMIRKYSYTIMKHRFTHSQIMQIS